MKAQLKQLLFQSLKTLQSNGVLDSSFTLPTTIIIERARDTQYGDYASNIALQLAKALHLKPRDLAEQLVANLKEQMVRFY